MAHACIRLVRPHPELVAVQVVPPGRRHARAMMSGREAQARRSSTTGRGSAAGRASPASERSKASCARRSTPSFRAGTGSRSPAAPTPACTRPARLRASTSKAARRSERAAEALNAALPDDVAVLAAEEAPEDFHARFSARSRSYRYRVLARRDRAPLDARRVLWWPRPIDVDALARPRRSLLGEHDFRAFTPTETRHESFVRNVLAAAWERTATGSTSRSRPTASSGTWCGRSSGRCSRRGRRRPTRMSSCSRAGRARGGAHRAAVGPLPRARRTTEGRTRSCGRRGYDRTVPVRFRIVLFDLDGTLIDSGPIILASMQHAVATVLGREIPPDELGLTIGGQGIVAQMQAIDAEHADDAARGVQGAQRRRCTRRSRRSTSCSRCSPAEGGGAEARHRHGQAPPDGRRSRRAVPGARGRLRRRRRARGHGAPQAGPGPGALRGREARAARLGGGHTSATRRSTSGPRRRQACSRSRVGWGGIHPDERAARGGAGRVRPHAARSSSMSSRTRRRPTASPSCAG